MPCARAGTLPRMPDAAPPDPDLAHRARAAGSDAIRDALPRAEPAFFLWNHDSLGVWETLDAVSMADLSHNLALVPRVSRHLRGFHARLRLLVDGGLLQELRAPGGTVHHDGSTRPAPLRAVKLQHVLAALLMSPDGRVQRKKLFQLLRADNIGDLLPWLLAYSRKGRRRRDGRSGESDEDLRHRASRMARYQRGVAAAARPFHSEQRAPADRATLEHLISKHHGESPEAVAAALQAARDTVRARADDDRPWLPDAPYSPDSITAAVMRKPAPSAPGMDSPRVSHL